MKKGIDFHVLGGVTPDRKTEDVVSDVARLYALGFESLDLSISMKNWKERAPELRGALDEKGFSVHQTHAPFRRNNSGFKGGFDDYKKCLENTVEYTAILGAKYCVVHAEEYYPTVDEPFDAKKAHALLYELYAPYVELARKRGVTIAFESLFEEGAIFSEPRSRYSSRVEEVISLIESYNDSAVGCCWDFGHSQLSYRDGHFDAFKQAFKYIVCTHVHDNYAGMDLHLPPTLGNVDWQKFIPYMKENGYKGNLSFELHGVKMPDDLKMEYLSFVSKVGDYLLSL